MWSLQFPRWCFGQKSRWDIQKWWVEEGKGNVDTDVAKIDCMSSELYENDCDKNS